MRGSTLSESTRGAHVLCARTGPRPISFALAAAGAGCRSPPDSFRGGTGSWAGGGGEGVGAGHVHVLGAGPPIPGCGSRAGRPRGRCGGRVALDREITLGRARGSRRLSTGSRPTVRCVAQCIFFVRGSFEFDLSEKETFVVKCDVKNSLSFSTNNPTWMRTTLAHTAGTMAAGVDEREPRDRRTAVRGAHALHGCGL